MQPLFLCLVAHRESSSIFLTGSQEIPAGAYRGDIRPRNILLWEVTPDRFWALATREAKEV